MRITNKLTLDTNIRNYQTTSQAMYNHQAKLSSGLKIQNSYDNSSVYTDATRLDYEIALLEQAKETSTKASEFTKNSDDALKSFVSTLTNFKTKLVQAANIGEHNPSSLQALANDLEAYRSQLINVSNTSINGQFLFSGTALDTKPVSEDGSYNGNASKMNAVIGANQTSPYNIDGKTLFLGRDNDYNKISTTNVSLVKNREYLMDPDKTTYMDSDSKIYELIGGNYRSPKAVDEKGKLDHDKDFTPEIIKQLPETTFFMQGKKVSGESFSAKFNLSADSSLQKVLDKIGEALGNTENSKVVEVTLNGSAQIEVKDLKSGNILSEFSIFGLTQIEGAIGETTLTTAQIQDLQSQDDINNAISDGKVYLSEFIKSKSLNDNIGKQSDAADYDKLRFSKKDNILSSNTPQIIRNSGEYATNSTKLVEVAGLNLVDAKGNRLKDANGEYLKADLTKNYDKNGVVSDNKSNLTMQIKSRDGNNYQAKIEFVGSGSDKYPTLTINKLDNAGNVGAEVYKGNIYKGNWDASPLPGGKKTDGVKISANDLTYQNISDIVKVVAAGSFDLNGLDGVSENLDGSAADITSAYEKFNKALQTADKYVDAKLDYKGRMVVTDKTASVTKMEVSIFEDHSKLGDDYPKDVGLDKASKGNLFSFNANNAIAIDEPSVDIFKDLEDMIEAVRNGTYRADSEANNSRTTGIQGALKKIDHLLDHVDKQEAIVGTYTNTFTTTVSRARILAVNVNSVKSDVIDADYGEVALEFYNTIMSMQASLQATAKISQLSLLNYL